MEQYLSLAQNEASWFHRAHSYLAVDDLRGEAYVALAEAYARYDAATGTPLGAWITIQIRHRLSRWAEDQAHIWGHETANEDVIARIPAPESDAGILDRTRIVAAIRALPEREQAAIIKTYWLEESQDNLTSQLRQRAIRRLRKNLRASARKEGSDHVEA